MATATYFISAQCTGCKHTGEYTVSAHEHAVKCSNPDCPQYIGVSPQSGARVFDLCPNPNCKRAWEDHWHRDGMMVCRS